ncbi:MAG: T9SS type A sorting domain-containing protein [Bacteroidetes bacterium]|nr:T9SS type A sorting domain-containing protein [Bacteroidota bacterium]
MKKVLLLGPLFLISLAALGQLSGSSYYQDFNSLGSGNLPYNWQGDTIATATNLGTVVPPFFNNNTWKQVAGGFKNVASAHGLLAGADSVTQANSIDRAFAVRQTSGSGSFHGNDPGAAFVFKIDNTTNLTNFNLEFELQSLDSSSPRTTTWSVDYGLGANPSSFVTVPTTGNMTTGGNTFSTANITASFGSALDHQNQPVWIRIVALTHTTGSGNRATTAIDNFHLTWSGTAVGVPDLSRDKSIPVTVRNIGSSDVMVNYTLKQAAAVSIKVFDLSGREIYRAESLGRTGNNDERVHLNLPQGMYILRMTSGSYSSVAKFTL